MARPKGSKNVKAKAKRTIKKLSPTDVPKLIKQWDEKSIDELASEFGTSTQTIFAMGKAIHKEDSSLCKPKPKGGRSRADIAKAGIALFKKEMGKK